MSNLLPPNSTKRERTISEVGSRLGSIQIPIREIWNPNKCPVDLLPWLAWAFSVDDWNRSWSEEQKRQAVSASIFIHRHKGTPAAVRRAVGLVWDDFEVEEWFQYGGEPFYFRLNSTGHFASDDDYRRLIQLIDSAKNARSWLESIILRSEIETTLYIGTAVAQGMSTRVGSPVIQAEAKSALMTIGGGFHAANRLTVALQNLTFSSPSRKQFSGVAIHRSRNTTIWPTGHSN